MEESEAPPVVALVVAWNPGPWFEETLQALKAQDYPDLSVLVLDAASRQDLTDRVAAVLPGAFVRRLDANVGFARGANIALGMVEGASHVVVCHDDIAPDPDAIRKMVEEGLRSNAGIVAPKYVSWDDPNSLVCVGLGADKGGAVRNRVEPGEVDHGQHDTVRDVFVAPGGCVVVRADLLRALDGFDDEMIAFGEDVELSWRAQVAGARVVVAPQARVRHLEALASRQRSLARRHLSTYDLVRRHELRAVLTCYGRSHLLRVLPQVALLNLGEMLAAIVFGRAARARAIARAWGWNIRRARSASRRRSTLRSKRVVADAQVRRLQTHGSARLERAGRAWVARHQGESWRSWLARHDATRAPGGPIAPAGPGAAGQAGAEGGTEVPGAVASGGSAAPEGGPGDGTAGPARPSDGERRSRPTHLPPAGIRVRTTTWTAVALVLAFGSRSLLFGHIPLLGQFGSIPGPVSLLSRFVHAAPGHGLGAQSSASPVFALLGVFGAVLGGWMSLLQKILILGCLPVGLVGAARLAGRLASPWGRLVALVTYAALPLPYNALADGRLGALVAYATAPWVLGRLARASGLPPWAHAQPAQITGSNGGDAKDGPQPGGVTLATTAAPRRGSGALRRIAHWRTTLPGQAVTLGVLEAVTVPFAPTIALGVLLAGCGIAGTAIAAGGRRAAGRTLAVAAGGTLVAAVLWFPWALNLFWPGAHVSVFAGVVGPVSSAPGWGALLRFEDGPIGAAPLGWAFVAVAFLPVLIARGRRFGWATRFWCVAIAAWVVIWMGGRGWLGGLAVEPGILLAFAGASVAVLASLGFAAFEVDLPGYRFGWRHVVTTVAAVAIVVGCLPVLGSSPGGRWHVAGQGYRETLSWLNDQPPARVGPQAASAYAVLWIGDPTTLPLGGWEVHRGLAYGLSADGLPNLAASYPGSDPGELAGIAQVLSQVRSGRTVDAGVLLQRFDVRDIVVTTAVAPPIPGVQSATLRPVPPDVVAGLEAQPDLELASSVGGTLVFVNRDWPDLSWSHVDVTAALAEPAATPGTPWWRVLEVVLVGFLWAGTLWLLFVSRRPRRRTER